MKIACTLVSTMMVILNSIESSSQTSRNRNDASGPLSKGKQKPTTPDESSSQKHWNPDSSSVPLLKGMQSSSTPNELSMQYRGYKPPAEEPAVSNHEEKVYAFHEIPRPRFASTSAVAAPSHLYETSFEFTKKHVLIYEVPNELRPCYMPINNTGKGTPVVVDVDGNIVGVYRALDNVIYRIFDNDVKMQVTVNIYTHEVKPYSKVFGYLSL